MVKTTNQVCINFNDIEEPSDKENINNLQGEGENENYINNYLILNSDGKTNNKNKR